MLCQRLKCVLFSGKSGFFLESPREKCAGKLEKAKGNTVFCLPFCLLQKCLVVAVGSGFAIFDVVTGKLLTERRNAHKLKILHMEFIKERLENISMNDYLLSYGYKTIHVVKYNQINNVINIIFAYNQYCTL